MHALWRTGVVAGATALVIAATLGPPALAQGDCANADLRPGPGDAAAFEHSVVCLVNAEREESGRPRLQQDWRLARAAELHATDMVVREYFSHFSPGGSDVVERLRRVGYLPQRRFWMAGEVFGSRASHPAACPITCPALHKEQTQHHTNRRDAFARSSNG